MKILRRYLIFGGIELPAKISVESFMTSYDDLAEATQFRDHLHNELNYVWIVIKDDLSETAELL